MHLTSTGHGGQLLLRLPLSATSTHLRKIQLLLYVPKLTCQLGRVPHRYPIPVRLLGPSRRYPPHLCHLPHYRLCRSSILGYTYCQPHSRWLRLPTRLCVRQGFEWYWIQVEVGAPRSQCCVHDVWWSRNDRKYRQQVCLWWLPHCGC